MATKKLRECLKSFCGRIKHYFDKKTTQPQEDKALAFMADQNLNTIAGPKHRSHLILWAVISFFIIGLLWAKLAIVDEVTHAEGKVVPSQKIQIVENLEGGIVRKILVKEGQIVARDQILMHIDDTRFSSDYRESRHQATNLQARIARLTAETTGKRFIISPELQKNAPEMAKSALSLYKQRQSELNTKIVTLSQQVQQRKHELEELKATQARLKRSLGLVRRELNLTKPLVKEGAVSQVEIIRLEREVNDLAGELKNAQINVPRAKAALKESQNRIHELKMEVKTESLDELNKAKAEFAQLNESLTTLKDRVARTAVRSPVRGIVKQLNINTVGGVVDPGMELIEIVPLDDTLLIEAKIRPKDIGFIKPGDKAMVKFTAYDFAIYGGLEGRIEHISADAIKEEQDKESFYEIRVRTKKNYLGAQQDALPIIPGMQVTVDILTGEKSVLDYILKPILRGKERALRER